MQSVMKMGCALSAAAAAVMMMSVAAPDVGHARSWLNIDEVDGKVRGWRIGYSQGFAGCLAYTRFTDQTTFWFGYSLKKKYFIALTNPKWTPLESGQRYRLHVRMRKYGRWNGNFLAFNRAGEMGMFMSGLQQKFMHQFALSPGIHFYASGLKFAALSLRGSKAALESIERCFENRRFQAARDAAEAARRKAMAALPKTQPPAPHGSTRTAPVSAPKSPAPKRDRISAGTGFFVTDKGHLVTNNHVVKKCKSIKVGYSGGLLSDAKLLARDQRNDLALLTTTLPVKTVPALKSRVRVGDNIYVYGFPLSGLLTKTGNFTVGYITAAAGLNDDSSQLQISAPIQPGNSGGPLVDRHGNVVGVIVSKLNVMRVAKFTNDMPQNVNFAIKSSIAASFLETNGVELPAQPVADQRMEPADLAASAKNFTVRIRCMVEDGD